MKSVDIGNKFFKYGCGEIGNFGFLQQLADYKLKTPSMVGLLSTEHELKQSLKEYV